MMGRRTVLHAAAIMALLAAAYAGLETHAQELGEVLNGNITVRFGNQNGGINFSRHIGSDLLGPPITITFRDGGTLESHRIEIVDGAVENEDGTLTVTAQDHIVRFRNLDSTERRFFADYMIEGVEQTARLTFIMVIPECAKSEPPTCHIPEADDFTVTGTHGTDITVDLDMHGRDADDTEPDEEVLADAVMRFADGGTLASNYLSIVSGATENADGTIDVTDSDGMVVFSSTLAQERTITGTWRNFDGVGFFDDGMFTIQVNLAPGTPVVTDWARTIQLEPGVPDPDDRVTAHLFEFAEQVSDNDAIGDLDLSIMFDDENHNIITEFLGMIEGTVATTNAESSYALALTTRDTTPRVVGGTITATDTGGLTGEGRLTITIRAAPSTEFIRIDTAHTEPIVLDFDGVIPQDEELPNTAITIQLDRDAVLDQMGTLDSNGLEIVSGATENMDGTLQVDVDADPPSVTFRSTGEYSRTITGRYEVTYDGEFRNDFSILVRGTPDSPLRGTVDLPFAGGNARTEFSQHVGEGHADRTIIITFRDGNTLETHGIGLVSGAMENADGTLTVMAQDGRVTFSNAEQAVRQFVADYTVSGGGSSVLEFSVRDPACLTASPPTCNRPEADDFTVTGTHGTDITVDLGMHGRDADTEAPNAQVLADAVMRFADGGTLASVGLSIVSGATENADGTIDVTDSDGMVVFSSTRAQPRSITGTWTNFDGIGLSGEGAFTITLGVAAGTPQLDDYSLVYQGTLDHFDFLDQSVTNFDSGMTYVMKIILDDEDHGLVAPSLSALGRLEGRELIAALTDSRYVITVSPQDRTPRVLTGTFQVTTQVTDPDTGEAIELVGESPARITIRAIPNTPNINMDAAHPGPITLDFAGSIPTTEEVPGTAITIRLDRDAPLDLVGTLESNNLEIVSGATENMDSTLSVDIDADPPSVTFRSTDESSRTITGRYTVTYGNDFHGNFAIRIIGGVSQTIPDTGEFTLDLSSLASGTQTVSFSIPQTDFDGVVDAALSMRVFYTQAGMADADGTAGPDGEQVYSALQAMLTPRNLDTTSHELRLVSGATEDPPGTFTVSDPWMVTFDNESPKARTITAPYMLSGSTDSGNIILEFTKPPARPAVSDAHITAAHPDQLTLNPQDLVALGTGAYADLNPRFAFRGTFEQHQLESDVQGQTAEQRRGSFSSTADTVAFADQLGADAAHRSRIILLDFTVGSGNAEDSGLVALQLFDRPAIRDETVRAVQDRATIDFDSIIDDFDTAIADLTVSFTVRGQDDLAGAGLELVSGATAAAGVTPARYDVGDAGTVVLRNTGQEARTVILDYTAQDSDGNAAASPSSAAITLEFGADTGTTDPTDPTDASCLTHAPSLDFGELAGGETSGEATLAIRNDGASDSAIMVSATAWLDPQGAVQMGAGQTRVAAETGGYDSKAGLSATPAELFTLVSGGSKDAFLQLRATLDDANFAGRLSQTITISSSCG